MVAQRRCGGDCRDVCLFFVRFDECGGGLKTFAVEKRAEVLTAAQMRALEAAAIAQGGVSGLELMERAGRGVVAAIVAAWPDYGAPGPDGGHSAVVLCGPGNNGGDGFVVARLLQARGWQVSVFLYGDAGKLPGDARLNYDRWLKCGAVLPLVPGGSAARPGQADLADLAQTPGRPDIIIDALFGTGLSRAVTPPLRELFAATETLRQQTSCKLVAVDIASGLCADSGRVLCGGSAPGGRAGGKTPGKGAKGGSAPASDVPPAALSADLTVSFHRAKCGHYLAAGPAQCGRLVVADIGLPAAAGAKIALHGRPAVPGATVAVAAAVLQRVQAPTFREIEKRPAEHKFSHGHALVLTGGAGKTGAARLAARGALRIGAGLVTLGVPPAAQMEVALQITALMLQRLADVSGLEQMLQDKRITALCIGPGLGAETRHGDLVASVLQARRAALLDADALTLLARDADLFALLHAKVVLTPHAGEFARLFPDIAGRLQQSPVKGPAYSKLDATREAAKRAGCVVLFKGADTVIAAPDGRCSIHAAFYERTTPWLATAGAGDVLAGFITGLLARGFEPLRAAELAAWLHVECARVFGPGLIAEDLAEQLPQVLAGLK
jgi:ADP-dependent NAD(P)H-hydrate dehydratase / NAD(P)H-hydrate epimerase